MKILKSSSKNVMKSCKNKDFARADEIRDMLKEQNIILEDTPQGVRFKRG